MTLSSPKSAREPCGDVGEKASMQRSSDGNPRSAGRGHRDLGKAAAEWKGCQEGGWWWIKTFMPSGP